MGRPPSCLLERARIAPALQGEALRRIRLDRLRGTCMPSSLDAWGLVRIATEDRMRAQEPGDDWPVFVGCIIASTRIKLTTGSILLFEVGR